MKAVLTRVGPFGVKTDQHGDRWVGNGKGKYAVVKGDLQELFHTGDVVEIETKENGEYLNILSLKLLEKTTQSSSNGENNVPSNGRTRSDKYPAETANKDALMAAVTALGKVQEFKGDIAEYSSQAKGLAINWAKFIVSNNPRQEEVTNAAGN